MTAPFARVEKQELPESWKVVFDGAPGIPGMDFYEKRVAESIADRFNAAHRRAVEEAIAGYQKDALATHEELVKEAESRVWGEAAKIAEGERVEEIGPGDDAYNTAVKHIAEALRAKAASS